MNRNVVMFLIPLMALMLLALPLTASGATTQLYVDPGLVQKHPADLGTDFTVNIVVNSVNDLFAFAIRLTWDNTLITFVSLDNTPLNIIWPQGFFEPLPGYQTGAGYLRYDAVATGQPGYTGSGTLFTLKFHVASATPGSTSIHFDIHTLSDSLANPIAHTPTDGTYQMLSAGPSMPAVGGEWVPINTLQLLAPWVGLASLMALAAALMGLIKRRMKY